MEKVEVVVVHGQRATLCVGDINLKVDGDPAHADVEVQAMAMAPIPTRRSSGRGPGSMTWRWSSTASAHGFSPRPFCRRNREIAEAAL